ncbi:hypothetical protein D3C85_703900 [compost metagenome]
MNRNRRRNVYYSSRVANTEGLQGSVDGVMCRRKRSLRQAPMSGSGKRKVTL